MTQKCFEYIASFANRNIDKTTIFLQIEELADRILTQNTTKQRGRIPAWRTRLEGVRACQQRSCYGH